MWDTIKVIIGLVIMAVIIIICCVVSFLVKPINPAEVAQGLPPVPTFVVIGLVAFLIYEIFTGK
jgi:hypothetical protein